MRVRRYRRSERDGKTTLLKVINGTLVPDRGKVIVFIEDLLTIRNTNALRREIAFVPQKSNHHRFPLRVEEAVLMGRYGKIGLMRRPTDEDRALADDAMRLTGILPFGATVSELSGGEQQKSSSGRLSTSSILLLDEPTTYSMPPYGRRSWRRSSHAPRARADDGHGFS